MSVTMSATQLAPIRFLHRAAALSACSAAPANSAALRLVARLRAADESAFKEVVRRHHGALLRLALALLPNRALAEEAVQDTWVAVVDGLASFEGRSSLKTWIFRILFNRAKTCLRGEARSVPFSAMRDCASKELEVDPESTPERLLMQKDAIGCLERALQRLPPNQRAVVTLRVVEGLNPHGETGTGKELIDSLVHAERTRASAPLARFNCGAIPVELAEAELFGHARGSPWISKELPWRAS
jgi:RNA polymerase sigma-70 factor (ECF subfamily)